jgi:hypothetical protein
MIDRTLTRCSDEQLAYMLHETANWSVTSTNGKILCEAASLHCAVERAVEFGTLGHRIVTLVRERAPGVVLFSGQIRTLIDRFFAPGDREVVLHAMKA